jgi:hypothetical protein
MAVVVEGSRCDDVDAFRREAGIAFGARAG